MSKINPRFKFKGDPFENRYRLMGSLETQTPLHIGTGYRRKDEKGATDINDEDEHFIDEIARDFKGMPYLPGSSLRGVTRNYLLQIFRSFGEDYAQDPDYEKGIFKNMEQKDQINYMQTAASLLEQVMGTPFSESKVEFWDCPLTNKVSAPELTAKGWDDARQTYVVRSVAIDPVTGAAEKNKLYAFDVIPPGARFEVNIVGQNLNDLEMGFLLFGLYGFNSEIFPLTLGAMSGRGFGRMKFSLDKICCLTGNDLENWTQLALTLEHAGFNLVPELPDTARENKLKNVFTWAICSLNKPFGEIFFKKDVCFWGVLSAVVAWRNDKHFFS